MPDPPYTGEDSACLLGEGFARTKEKSVLCMRLFLCNLLSCRIEPELDLSRFNNSKCCHKRRSICTPSLHGQIPSHPVEPDGSGIVESPKAFYSIESRSHVRLQEIGRGRRVCLEDAVNDVAADRGSSTEYSSIAHLLAEFLAVLF